MSEPTTTIELPTRALGRNDIGVGNYWAYRAWKKEVDRYILTFGKRVEFHYADPVDVRLDCYYFEGRRPTPVVNAKTGIATMQNRAFSALDSPNIEDKILTDILTRKGRQEVGRQVDPKTGKDKPVYKMMDKPVWWIQDDKPLYLRDVVKCSHPAERDRIVITITPAEVAV